MTYTIHLSSYNTAYRKLHVAKFKRTAISRLMAFPRATTEKLLDTYLRDQYQITLTYACYSIILKCKIEEIKDELVVTISDPQLDKLARMITFGTGKLSGSQILAFALNKL